MVPNHFKQPRHQPKNYELRIQSNIVTMTKQHVWLVRYGKTEYPLVEYDGPYDSK
jgi:hypothetical protein